MNLFIGNFEFEYRVRSGSPGRLPETIRRRSAELAFSWIAQAGEGDLIWTPAGAENDFKEHLTAAGFPATVSLVSDVSAVPANVDVCPWGWTDDIRRWADRNRWRYSAPRQSSVQTVNSRRFSHRLEQELNVALEGATEIHSLEDLSAAVSRLPGECEKWVVKAMFSMAGRERAFGRGRRFDDHTAAWIRKRIAADGAVYFEPWVERIDEAGLQFDLPHSGDPQLVGVTPLLSSTRGTYRGSRIAPASTGPAAWADAVETAIKALERMQHGGYFGPVGIDAVRFRDHRGEIRLRPLMDINARWTMGRLSLGLSRRLAPGELATWLHVGPSTVEPLGPAAWHESVSGRLPPGVRGVRTSPLTCGGIQAQYQTLLLVSMSMDDLAKAEAIALAAHRPAHHD